jgi:hypothetical protein
VLSRTMYKKQRGRRLITALATLGLLSGILITTNAVLAVNQTGRFELDGNATTTTSDDWDEVCHQVLGNDCSTANNTNGATAVSWSAEADPSASIFTGGGSKDPQDPEDSWAWKDEGGLPDKDNLLHGFAARYSLPADAATCPAGSFATCEVIFFGSTRFANDGDAVQGFWFFQNKIQQTNIPSGGGFKFSGHHKNGDLLIISDFSNGGSVSTIFVHKWDTTCAKAANNDPQPNQCSAQNLRLAASSTNANCVTSAATAGFCGIVNTGATNVASPWPFLDKAGSTSFRQGEFFEGGVNLSTLGLGGECFSSVASETRSSTSPTATLKDFVLGQFASCTATMSTTASNTGTVAPGTSITDTATIVGSSPTNDPSGTVTFFLCSGVSAGGSCPTGGTNIGTGALSGGGNGTSTATSPAVAPTTPGRYCFRAEWPGDTNYTTALSHTNSTTECFTVQDTTAINSDQKWLPNDSATVTAGAGSALNGTLTLRLYESGDCTGTAVYTEAFTLTAAASPATRTTSNTSVYVEADSPVTISWQATFVSSDAGVAGQTGPCETSSLTIDDNDS